MVGPLHAQSPRWGDAWAVSAIRLRRLAICSAVSCRPVQLLMYDTLTSRFWLSRFGHTAQHEACWTERHGTAAMHLNGAVGCEATTMHLCIKSRQSISIY